jgi:LPXTG-site transpeptidase (sortase) family protein
MPQKIQRPQLQVLLRLIVVLLILTVTFSQLNVTRGFCASRAVTTLSDNGPGSLRQIITEAQPNDEIYFAVQGNIILTSGEIIIDKPLEITGPGPGLLAISGNYRSRIFFIEKGIDVAITNLTLRNGKAYDGGAILNNGANLTITNCDIHNNQAHFGGAIYNWGNLELHNSALFSNIADNSGGALRNLGEILMTNSVLANNIANTMVGGAIDNSGPMNVQNSSIVQNTAGTIGGGLNNPYNAIEIQNSIIALNRASRTADNCFGKVISLGYNLESSDECGFNALGDRQYQDPLIESLDQKKETESHYLPLDPHSPAINQVPEGSSGCGAPPYERDQRRYIRDDGVCDIGAYEHLATPNRPPSDVALDNNTIPEDVPLGTIVGTFTSEDPDDIADFHNYFLVDGKGGKDNHYFTIIENKLVTQTGFNYENQKVHQILVSVVDRGGQTLEKSFDIFVTDVGEMPGSSVPVGYTLNRTLKPDEEINPDEEKWNAGAISNNIPEGTNISIKVLSSNQIPIPETGLVALDKQINMQVLNIQGEVVDSLHSNVNICYTYDENDLETVGDNPGSLILASLNQNTGDWQPLITSHYPDTEQICAHAAPEAIYGLFAASLPQTGFAPGHNTEHPFQPEKAAYDDLGELWLEIPKLGVRETIIGVPLTDHGWDLTWLDDRIGYLSGTAYPTWNGNTALTGHVFNADGTYGPFSDLKQLNWKDEIIIHAWGQRYIYEIQSRYLANPDDLGIISSENQDWITLITCRGYDKPSNTYIWRMIIRAVLVRVEPDPIH